MSSEHPPYPAPQPYPAESALEQLAPQPVAAWEPHERGPTPYGAHHSFALAAPIEELLVPYSAEPLTEKLGRRRRGLRSRLVSLVITAVILVLLYFFGPEQLRGGGFLALYGVALGFSVAWFLGYLLAYLLARRELRSLGTGTAVRIGRPGVQVAGLFTPWSEVSTLGMASGRFGRRPRLELRHTNGPVASVPLNQIVVLPATLDSTARAYSGGRQGVDLSALEV